MKGVYHGKETEEQEEDCFGWKRHCEEGREGCHEETRREDSARDGKEEG